MVVDEVDLYIITFLGIFGGARWVTTNFILCTTVLLTHSAEVVGSTANICGIPFLMLTDELFKLYN